MKGKNEVVLFDDYICCPVCWNRGYHTDSCYVEILLNKMKPTQKTYTIKPLEWREEKYEREEYNRIVADVPFGFYYVEKDHYGFFLYATKRTDKFPCSSTDEGKQKCQDHWNEFLERFLEEVR